MIPRTFPSSRASNGATQMIVYFLPSVAGLTRWVDYIPVKFTTVATPTTENTYNQNGYIPVVSLSSIAGATPFKEYVPVFLDSNAADADVWDVTITGFIPVGTAGIGGAALYMDFAATTTLDPRITFGRTTNATVTGSDGVLRFAPHNLLTHSEQFDNSAWNVRWGGAGTVTANDPTFTAPDGTTTVDRFTATVGNSGVGQAVTLTAGVTYTLSCWFNTPTVSASLVITTSAVGGGIVASSTIPSGSTLTRYSLTYTPPTTQTYFVGVNTGSALQTFYIWGAQLEIGSTATAYNPTTVKNLLGFTQEFDNAAWTKSNSFVQTNFIRNNTGQGAAAGTPGTLPTNWSVSGSSAAGLTRTVVGVGTENGISYIDLRFQGTPSAGSLNIIFESAASAATLNQVWAQSAYVAIVGGSLNNVSAMNLRFDEGSPYVRTTTTTNIPTLTSQLLRYSGTGTIGATTTQITGVYFNAICAAAPIDFTLRIGLPQLVQGATAGDVVATYGTAAAVGYTAPDGSLTADKLVEDTATAGHFVGQSVSATSGVPYTVSIYAKAAERSVLQASPSASYLSAGFANFDLVSGTVTASSANVTASMQNMGNGWYRCVTTFTATSTATGNFAYFVQTSTTALRGASYAGNGTSGILIWGAQVSDSASLDPYVYQPVAAPASTAYYGPRFDYDPVTLAPRGLLIEEQRTNLSSNSVLASAWGAPSAASYTDTQALAPDGTNTAWRLTEDTTNAVHFGSMNSINIAYTSGTTYTVSRFLKAAGRTQVSVYLPGGAFASSGRVAVFDLSAGTVVSTEAGVTASIQNVGNGWYRCATTATANASVAAHVGGSALNGGAAYQGNGTSGVFVWGHQLEAGAFATSYIPTTTAAATRAADVATMIGANFSSWYRQDEGTWFAEAVVSTTITDPTTRIVFGTSTGSFNESVYLSRNSSSGAMTTTVISGGVAQAAMQPANTVTATIPFKAATSIQTNNFAFSLNGGLPSVDTLGVLPSQTGLTLGNANWSGGVNWLNGHIRRIAYYSRRLSNTELQTITS